jgi:hypothetical protein
MTALPRHKMTTDEYLAQARGGSRFTPALPTKWRRSAPGVPSHLEARMKAPASALCASREMDYIGTLLAQSASVACLACWAR